MDLSVALLLPSPVKDMVMTLEHAALFYIIDKALQRACVELKIFSADEIFPTIRPIFVNHRYLHLLLQSM